MPVTSLSDRKMTVNYAIDLLRAHQIRRENVFLHEQLQTCVKEVAMLREEIRDSTQRQTAIENEVKPIKVSIVDHDTKASAIFETQETRLNDQARELRAVRQSCRALQTETSDIKASYHDAQTVQQTQIAIVEKQTETLENLQRALDSKADTALVKVLESRVNKLWSDQNAGIVVIDSVSHVSETAEHESVQVRDSLPDRSEPQQAREMTLPNDLDLDANAHTISYAGYECRAAEPSLRMLSPLPIEASRLAEIKTLRQRRFDGWDHYYDQGQELVQALPQDFEETIIHHFVEGLYQTTHRKQCQQWLDSSGWTWANVTAFGNLCSQLLANDTSVETSRPRQIDAGLAAVGKSGQRVDGVGKEAKNGKVPRDTVDAPLRRSQRVAQKQNLQTQTEKRHEVESNRGPPAHRTRRDITQGSRLKTNPGKVPDEAQRQRQAVDATEPRAPPQKSAKVTANPQETGAAKTTTFSAKRRESHKRRAVVNETDHSAKQPKPRPTAPPNHHISPKLVSFRGQNAELMEESSNDEGFLHNDPKPSFPTRVRQRAGHRKRGLPLPPPPEIPILPTTDEE
ncbi:hypothetical protein AYO20_10785 [Fonsecaea nubica]|uniref:Uncharacterized protein n=1 Tax=Fonsecaea nubica TaxID=856822 RepID=A0A178C2B0_9EURO|nr:hypothetical protein AYO20_10785 [Fonsecaea nubica]OAL24040.1 hypothetical protein AYO20_10785 [Fonsecaea nubica]